MLMVQFAVILVVLFSLVVFFLHKILYSTFTNETQRLQALSEANEKKSRELESKLEMAMAQHQEIIDEAQNRAEEFKRQAEAQAQKMAEEMIAKARNESERLLHQVAKARDQIRREIEEQMLQKSTAQALRLIREILSVEKSLLLHQGLIQETIESLEKMEGSSLPIDTDKGQLISPVAVEPADKQRIVGVLSQKTGRTIVLQDVIDEDLVAGLSIRLGSMVIDGSLAEKIREASIKFKV